MENPHPKEIRDEASGILVKTQQHYEWEEAYFNGLNEGYKRGELIGLQMGEEIGYKSGYEIGYSDGGRGKG